MPLTPLFSGAPDKEIDRCGLDAVDRPGDLDVSNPKLRERSFRRFGFGRFLAGLLVVVMRLPVF
jgi:hypothetical protein